MRASLVIEPAVLAMPALSEDEQSIARSIERIIQVSGAIRDDDFGICLLGEAENYLAEAQLYPVSHSISQALADCGLSHVYTPEDIRRSVQNILQRASRLEDVSGVEFLIPESMRVEPDILSTREEAALKEALEVTLAHVAMLTERASKLSVRALLADVYADDEVELFLEITNIAPPLPDRTDRRSISCPVGLSNSVFSFADKLDGDELWRMAENEPELSAAIAVKARSLRRASGCPAPKDNCEKFAIGSAFLDTLRACQSVPSGKYGHAAFEAFARLVAGSPTAAPKKLYKLSETGRREDVVRTDGAIGWRLHITKSGEAIRLMFWRRHDASIEFANVGPKADVKIH